MQIGVCLLPAAARFNYFYYTFFMLGPELTSRKCSASDPFFFFKGWEKFLNVVSIQVEFCKLICPPVPTGVGSFLVCLERKCQAPVVAPTFCHGSKINIKWQNRGRGFHNNCFAPAGWACVVSVRCWVNASWSLSFWRTVLPRWTEKLAGCLSSWPAVAYVSQEVTAISQNHCELRIVL